MSVLLSSYGYHLLSAVGGLLFGGLAGGWIVRNRMKMKWIPQLAQARSEAAVLNEKLTAGRISLNALQQEVVQIKTDLRASQEKGAELAAVKAGLEARAEFIPDLEKTLRDLKARQEVLQAELRKETAALAQARERGQHFEKVRTELEQKQEALEQHQNQAGFYRAEIAELKTLLDEERKQFREKITLLQEARDQLKSEFRNLAQQIFDEKSRRFVEHNRTSMDQLISPLRQQLGDFKKRVEDVYDKETRDRASLQAEIHHLKELNQRIGKEALNLTRALKGDSKTQGGWGEVVLERVLEASGLKKGREYDVQVSLKDGGGRRYQPDVIVRLPEKKDVIIDAKVSLKAYETYYSAEDTGERRKALKAHVESLRGHVRGLASKSYEDLEGVRSLDFILMFVPIEAAFLAAVDADGEIFSEAFEKNIMVVSPSTLLVTLRTIQNIWRYEYQNRNALEIAKKAGGLYDKFVGFVEALEDLGQHLDKAKQAYTTAHGRLTAGRGNLVRKTQELRELGVKAGKELSAELIETAGNGES